MILNKKLRYAVQKTISDCERYSMKRPLICFTPDVKLFCDDCPFCVDGYCESPKEDAEFWKKYLRKI